MEYANMGKYCNAVQHYLELLSVGIMTDRSMRSEVTPLERGVNELLGLLYNTRQMPMTERVPADLTHKMNEFEKRFVTEDGSGKWALSIQK